MDHWIACRKAVQFASKFNSRFLQVNAKTRLIYGGMVFSWIFLPLYLTLAGSLGTYIINGVCEPWGRYSTYAAQVTMNVSMISITYLIPLMMMAFFYTRIVCALRSKVG